MTTTEHEVEFLGQRVRLRAPKDDHIERQLRKGHLYEAPLLEHLASLDLRGEYVDVGAHIGNHSVAFAMMGASTVVSYEPWEPSYDLLVDNLRAVSDSHIVRLAAVHDEWSGAVASRLVAGNSGMTTFAEHVPGIDHRCVVESHRPRSDWDWVQNLVRVGVRRLDDDLAKAQVALIKCDVEGGELPVLRSARQTLERCRPIVVCEAHDRQAFELLDGYLSELGYAQRGSAWCATPTYVWHHADRR